MEIEKFLSTSWGPFQKRKCDRIKVGDGVEIKRVVVENVRFVDPALIQTC